MAKKIKTERSIPNGGPGTRRRYRSPTAMPCEPSFTLEYPLYTSIDARRAKFRTIPTVSNHHLFLLCPLSETRSPFLYGLSFLSLGCVAYPPPRKRPKSNVPPELLYLILPITLSCVAFIFLLFRHARSIKRIVQYRSVVTMRPSIKCKFCDKPVVFC